MTISSHATPARTLATVAVLLLAAAPLGVACAGQPAPQRVHVPPPSVQFQQTVQQQHVRDQLQKSQLQQQLHQSVADNAKRPGTKDAQLQRQLDLADQARRDRDRAALKDLLDRQQAQAALPRVIPQQNAPASSRSGG